MCVLSGTIIPNRYSSALLSFVCLQWDDRTLRLYDPKFDLILLHPSLFLLRNQPLVSLDTRDPPAYAFWTVIDRELRRMGSAPDPSHYPPFSFTSRRVFEDVVNPFLLILYAGLTLQRHRDKYGFDALTPRQHELAGITLEAYDLIYYRPRKAVLPPPRAQHVMEQDNSEESSSDLGSSEYISVDEGYQILAKFDDPSTTLEERKELGALLLGGKSCKSPMFLIDSHGSKVWALTVALFQLTALSPLCLGWSCPKNPVYFKEGKCYDACPIPRSFFLHCGAIPSTHRFFHNGLPQTEEDTNMPLRTELWWDILLFPFLNFLFLLQSMNFLSLSQSLSFSSPSSTWPFSFLLFVSPLAFLTYNTALLISFHC